MQSAWDSVGRRRPHTQPQGGGASAQGGGASGARASPLGVRESGEGWETPRGAEASQYTPHKGNNVRVLFLLSLAGPQSWSWSLQSIVFIGLVVDAIAHISLV